VLASQISRYIWIRASPLFFCLAKIVASALDGKSVVYYYYDDDDDAKIPNRIALQICRIDFFKVNQRTAIKNDKEGFRTL
jgi:hypothetical protein